MTRGSVGAVRLAAARPIVLGPHWGKCAILVQSALLRISQSDFQNQSIALKVRMSPFVITKKVHVRFSDGFSILSVKDIDKKKSIKIWGFKILNFFSQFGVERAQLDFWQNLGCACSTRFLGKNLGREKIFGLSRLTPVARLNLLREKVSISQTQTQIRFPFYCVLSWIPPIQFFQTAKGKAPKEAGV